MKRRPASGPIRTQAGHLPVLLNEVLDALAVAPGQVVVDGTVGLGGHAVRLAGAAGPRGRLVGLDRDPMALAAAHRRLSAQTCPFSLHRTPYSGLPEVLAALGMPAVDRILLDLGVSSLQLDTPSRGFSFRFDAPLDMRMGRSGLGPTAADLVNGLPETELADLLYTLGEERHSRRIAKRVVGARRKRTIETTGELAELVRRAVPGRSPIDKATRTFQALRIAVNDELGELQRALETFPDCLASGGRLGIISFHSLEDRLVKRLFRERAAAEGFALVTRKPIQAGDTERAANPRSRSAKLRVLERL